VILCGCRNHMCFRKDLSLKFLFLRCELALQNGAIPEPVFTYLFVIQATLLWAMQRNPIKLQFSSCLSLSREMPSDSLYRKARWRGLLRFPGQRLVPVRSPLRRVSANFYFLLPALSGSLALCCERVEPRDAHLLKLSSGRTQYVSKTIIPRMSWNNAAKNSIP
jgi:hypothetical protein